MKVENLKKDCFYHIYNSGNNGDDIFKNKEDYQYFLHLLNEHLIPQASIFAYCLLKNHYHLLIRVEEEEENVTRRLSGFLSSYAKAFNKANNRRRRLFEKDLKRIRLDSEEYIKNLILHIHTKPQRDRIITSFRRYKFSSYRVIISNKRTKIKREEVIELFGGLKNFRIAHIQKGQGLNKNKLWNEDH